MFEGLIKKEENDVFGVYNKKIKKYEIPAIKSLPKLLALVVRYNKLKKEDSKNVDKVADELYDVLKTWIPIIVDVINYNYEVIKQVENNIGKEKLLEYVISKGKDPIAFARAYNNNKNTTIKMLILFSVLKQEGLTINDFINNPDIAMNIMNGESELDLIASKFDGLSIESREVIEDAIDKQQPYTEFSQKYLVLADQYHTDYMTEHIYPNVKETNSPVISEERVLKLAAKLGKTKITSL